MTSLLAVIWLLLAIAIDGSVEQDPLFLPIPVELVEYDDPIPKLPGVRQRIPDLYQRRYSDITWIGAHNSEAVRTEQNGWTLSGNQYFNLTTQLDSGIRLIQAQGHNDSDGTDQIRLCHHNCALLDGGSLDDYLLTAKRWLDENPNEFITFLFVNSRVTLDKWADTFYRTGFDLISYIPPRDKRHGRMGIEDWPTVDEMVSNGKRAVTFLSSAANERFIPYLLPEFDYIFETPFQNFEPDPSFPCSPQRRWSPPEEPVPNRLSLVNHFLYGKFFGIAYPFVKLANHTNGAGFTAGELGEHAARCRTQYGRRPNFFLVDFFNEGDVWDVEHGMNAY